MTKYVVLDLEMCTQTKKQKYIKGYKGSEIIQIGAVKLDENYKPIDTFMNYVKPEFVSISPRIQNLTGIKEASLVDQPSFKEVIKCFSSWLGEENIIGVSWSKTDSVQLRKEMKYKSYNHPRIHKLLKNWIDCQLLFKKAVEADRIISLGKALELADTNRVGYDHDALTDARNTASLFEQIMREELPEIWIEPLPVPVQKQEV